MSVELVILVDDSPSGPLAGEHGLAVLVSGPGRRVLFDAAATGEALLGNAKALGVDLSTLDAAVISHGHCDHTGGLAAAVQQRPGLPVYVHSGAFDRRWSDKPGEPLKDISCPHSIERLYQSGAVFHSVTHPEPLESWLVVSGPIGGPKHGRDVFVVRKGGELVVDGFADEMCLLVRGQAGWAVLTGCCHRGLKNTLRKARFLTHDEPLIALVGGLHLADDDQAGIAEALDLLAQYAIADVYPCHCTGPGAVKKLQQALGGRVHPLAAGSRVIF
jgi:7,8-dihydropterin-6-yl-methyl-4-(beta-D-ribofuranosyl)aminobenzene 5'-phosphate synthase